MENLVGTVAAALTLVHGQGELQEIEPLKEDIENREMANKA